MYSQFNLSNDPNQSFKVTVSGDSKDISFLVQISYNSMAEYWTMSLLNPNTNAPIVTGIPLQCGHDLLEQFQYLNMGSVVLANGSNISDFTRPKGTNLSNFYLIWKL